jgi:hypothetical protein
MTTCHTDLLVRLRDHTCEEDRDVDQAIELLKQFARYIVGNCNYKRLDDHACARCVGSDGEMVQAGFVCSFHVAQDLLSDEPKKVQTRECPVCRTGHDLPLCPESK